MKHKMIHYRGYFLLALALTLTGACVEIGNTAPGFPFFAVGLVFWGIGSAKVAHRNAQLKSSRPS